MIDMKICDKHGPSFLTVKCAGILIFQNEDGHKDKCNQNFSIS